MEASRDAVSVKIFKGMIKSIDEYSLAEASHDIDAYYLAGSLPGAIIATSGRRVGPRKYVLLVILIYEARPYF